MRVTQICTKTETRENQHEDLKEMLLERDYRPGMINSAIQRAQKIPRKQAINFIGKTPSTKTPVFVTSFDPCLPNV